MTLKFVAAILTIAALPLVAHAQQQTPRPQQPQQQANPAPNGPKPTVAEVQRVIGSISADKDRTQAYCDMVKLDDELAQAEEKKDSKQAQEIASRSEQMARKVGQDYITLIVNLQQVDPASNDGKQMVAAFEALEKRCSVQ